MKQSTVDYGGVPHHATHNVDLVEQAVHKLGAIATTNSKPLNALADQATFNHKVGTPLVALYVDHEHSHCG